LFAMKTIALICPTVPSHLAVMAHLGRELHKRGHRVVLVALADAERHVRESGLAFASYGQADLPTGSVDQIIERLGQLEGQDALRLTVEYYRRETAALLADAPRILDQWNVDLVISDQSLPGGTVAESGNRPFVTLCCALPLNPEPGIPPCVTPWLYDPSPNGIARNQAGYAQFSQFVRPIYDELNRFRQQSGLSPLEYPNADQRPGDSPLATICQLPRAFDFPRTRLPETFHYVGPLTRSIQTSDVAFPYERLDDRPLIYASMGTLQNRHDGVFRAIAEAVEPLDAQLVLSLGRRSATIGSLPGDPIVVPYAPQRELLRRSLLFITHAGLNSALEALAEGVPTIALPVTNDQPGVAARLAYAGAGQMLSLTDLSAERLSELVRHVLAEPSYRRRALQLQEAIAESGGLGEAADIVEMALLTDRPVLRDRSSWVVPT
jgi:MGT family glycosyltransferase